MSTNWRCLAEQSSNPVSALNLHQAQLMRTSHGGGSVVGMGNNKRLPTKRGKNALVFNEFCLIHPNSTFELRQYCSKGKIIQKMSLNRKPSEKACRSNLCINLCINTGITWVIGGEGCIYW